MISTQLEKVKHRKLNRRENYKTHFYKLGYFANKHLEDFIISSIETYIKPGNTVADIGCGEHPLKSLIQAKGAK